MNRVLLFVGLGPVCLLASCWPGSAAPVALPPAQTSPIAVSRVVIRIPARAVIGQHYEGDPPEAQSSEYWGGGGERYFTNLLLEVLRKRGYTVITADSIARSADDDAPRARFELRGTMTDVSENSYGGRNVFPERFDVWMVVSWELYDVSRNAVVFSTTHRGSVESNNVAVVFDRAFQSSARQLLFDRGFVTRVGTPAGERGDSAAEPMTHPSSSSHPWSPSRIGGELGRT